MSATGIKAGMAILAASSIAALGAAPALATGTGDFNNDGFQDLAVGVPGEDVGPATGPEVTHAGAVDAFYGRKTGLVEAGNDHWTQNSAGVKETAEAGDRFGSSVATGDINGDDFDDLAIGVPQEDIGPAPIVNAGAVEVLYGSPTGLTAAGNDFIFFDPEEGDRFGAAVAVADMFDDARADLAVGAPGENGNTGEASRF